MKVVSRGRIPPSPNLGGFTWHILNTSYRAHCLHFTAYQDSKSTRAPRDPIQVMKKYVIAVLSIGLITSLFPWVCTYTGDVAGHSVSLRALGDFWGLVLGIIGVRMFVDSQFRTRIISWFD